MKPTFWPTPQDYNEAIQNPSLHLADSDLVNGTVDTNALGLPRSMSGAFASVYKIVSGGKGWAVRCFLSNRPEQQERYRSISDFVLMDDLECTIDFYYIENGIKIRNEWFPILKMPWVDGDTLDRWVFKHYKDTEQMKRLLADFHNMVAAISRAGISHCDLQVGNILVSPEGLRLVDYDALFVPALAGKKSLEVGHPSFQHPGRTASLYSATTDNFSAWLIHTGLMAIAIDPGLYEKYCNGDDNLLFRRGDLADPEGSELFKTLLNHNSENIRDATLIIKRMLWCAPDKIPALGVPNGELDSLPKTAEERYVAPSESNGVADGAEAALSLSPSTETPLCSDSINEVPTFDWIDDDAALTRAANKKSKKVDVIKVLKTRAITGLDNFHMWFSVNSWAGKNMDEAKKYFDHGDFDRALKIYHRVYKALEADNGADNDNYSSCLFRLGCCYEASTTPSLATNYFLLAMQKGSNGGSAIRPALHLAVIRFKSGDETGAVRAILETYSSPVDILETVTTELFQTEIDRIALIKVLMALHSKLIDAVLMDRAVEALSAAWFTIKTAVKAGTIDRIDEYLDPIFAALARLKNTKKINDMYVDISAFCVGSRGSVRGLIAFLCSAVQDYVDHAEPEPISIKAAIITVAKSDMSSDEHLSMLKQALLSVARPAYVAEIFVRISHELIEGSKHDTAVSTMKVAFDLTSEFDLPISETMLSEMEGLADNGRFCLEPIIADDKVFKRIIVQLSNARRVSLLVSIAKSLRDAARFDVLATLLTTLNFCASPRSIEELYGQLGLLPQKDTLDSQFNKNLVELADSLKILCEKQHDAS